MAIDVFPKLWSAIPPVSARAVQGHPLCPRFGFLFNSGRMVDVVGGVVGESAGSTPGTYSPGSARGYAGTTREHDATTDFDRLGDGNLILPPTNDVTIVLGYEKTDATLRQSTAFGGENASSPGFIVNCHLPWQDGVVYWDWSDQSSGRQSVAGLTFGDDVWAFTTGPRAQEVWQNGILRGTKATAPDKGPYGAGTEQFALGKTLGVQRSDLAKYKFVYVYWRQLGVHDIAEITAHPFCWVDPRP